MFVPDDARKIVQTCPFCHQESTRPQKAKTLHSEAKRLFSLVVRYSAVEAPDGKVTCVTCGDRYYPWSKKLQAGHFIHRAPAVKYDRENVHPQCSADNGKFGKAFFSQNINVDANYRAYIARRYGPDKPDELWQRAQQKKKFTAAELVQLIANLHQELVQMDIPH